MIGAEVVVLLIVWGTIAGLDLVSVPQMMLSRPLVVGGVAGVILGDVGTGLRVGLVLELFALDLLPVGATRYPDYGPATVAAAAAAVGWAVPWEQGLGPSVSLGLGLGALGGSTHRWMRRANVRALHRRADAVGAGEAAATRALQYGGLMRDTVRAAALTALGLAAAWLLIRLPLDRPTGVALTIGIVGAGLGAALSGGLRTAGRGTRLRWLAAGLAVGLVLLTLR